MSRIGSRCSKAKDRKEQLRRFQCIKADRGHKVLAKNVKRNVNLKQNDGDMRLFLNVPFISDRVNGMVKKALQPLGLRVNLSHKSKHLKDVINFNFNRTANGHESCDLKSCVLKNKDCVRTHVVYEMKCLQCNSCYIGSTKRKLHQRVKEHLVSQKSSLVYQHNLTCKGEWTTKILYATHHLQHLRFMESILIRRHSPQLNGKENVFNEHIVF